MSLLRTSKAIVYKKSLQKACLRALSDTIRKRNISLSFTSVLLQNHLHLEMELKATMPYIIRNYFLTLLTFTALMFPNFTADAQNTTARASTEGSRILQRLEQANKLPGTISSNVYLQNDDVLNAWTDGKNIFITDTLWDKLETPDERAFVIGHELSHITLGHIQRTQVRRVGLGLAERLFSRYTGNSRLLDLAENVGLNLIDLKFSRNLEYQADDMGFHLTTKAGYRPEAALRVFQVLSQGNRGGIEFLSSHPMSESRVRALVKKYQLQAR
jgi:Zn-dependent protease with chaperone function